MSDVRETLNQRGARYGTFMNNAIISNATLAVWRGSSKWSQLADDQVTALEIIAQKIARALTGDPDYDDNWRDIAGYAQLIVDRINGEGAYAEQN